MRTLSYDKTASDHSRPTTKRVHSPREPDATTIPDPMMMMNKKSVFLVGAQMALETLSNSEARRVATGRSIPWTNRQTIQKPSLSETT